jgi:hypothetical protein
MEKSLRYNEDKPKWSLVHYKSLEPMVRVLEMGAKKYSPDNWKIGLNRDEILESTMRHLTALMDGELLDKESGISHMAHIQCNAMFYNYHEANNSFTRTEEEIHRELDYLNTVEANHISSATIAPTREDDGYIAWSYNDTLSWSERKKATFKFFNEFPEPWRSQAMKNYDEEDDDDLTYIPSSPQDSVHIGFVWCDTSEGSDYWERFSRTLPDESA